MKLEDIMQLKEGIEDEHSDVVNYFLENKQRFSRRQIDLFNELMDSFAQAYEGNDPYGNSMYDYLDEMKDVIGYPR